MEPSCKNDYAPDSFIPDKQVGPATKNKYGDMIPVSQLRYHAELLRRFGHKKTIRRTTDTKGGVTAHGLIYFYLLFI